MYDFSFAFYLDLRISEHLNSEMNTSLLFLAIFLAVGNFRATTANATTTPGTTCCPKKVFFKTSNQSFQFISDNLCSGQALSAFPKAIKNDLSI